MTTHHKASAILIWFMLVLMACNLGTSDSGPPTLAPLPTNTPIATLGYAAAGPTGIPGIGTTPQAPINTEIFRLLDQVESDRLLFHISTLQNFYTRHVNSTQGSATQGIGAARAYITDQFNAYVQSSGGNLYTFDIGFDVNFEGVTTQHKNIAAVIQGTEAGAGTIIVGAHYDSVGEPYESGTAFAPGANDNGSGVSAVLELARIMSQRQYKSTIIFVLFSAEEVGRYGSRAFAAWVNENKLDVVGMINVDTIGNVNDRGNGVNDRELRIFSAGPNETSVSRRMARMVNFIGFNYGLDLDLTVQDAIDRENRYGDHFSFSELGYPAVRFINAYEEKTNADPTDTVEFVEAEYLRQSTQALLSVITTLADGPQTPRNVALRDLGNGMQELVWEPVVGASSYIVALRRAGSLIYEQQFEVTENSISWDKFSQYGGIAIATKSDTGLIGRLSNEIVP